MIHLITGILVSLVHFAIAAMLTKLTTQLIQRKVRSIRKLLFLAGTLLLAGVDRLAEQWHFQGAELVGLGLCILLAVFGVISLYVLFQMFQITLVQLDEYRRLELLVADLHDRLNLTSYESCTLQLEHQLHRTNESLRQANDELTRFVYAASHDLMAPLRTIVNFLQRLDRRLEAALAADPKAAECLHRAMGAAIRLQSLISDLKNFTSLTKNNDPLKAINLNGVVDAALEDLSMMIRDTGAVIERPDMLPSVLGNESQLVQVFENIIANGIKYQPQSQTPRIRIECMEITLGWRLSISDNGIGIDSTYQTHVFDVFKRLHTEDEYPGTGMGLAIVNRIIDRHNGRIWVESTPKQGSTFHFTLPP